MSVFFKIFFITTLVVLNGFSENLISNGNFEHGIDAWDTEGSVSFDKRKKSKTLFISNRNKEWSGAEQTVTLPKGTSKLILSGDLKVQYAKESLGKWPSCDISLVFLDGGGKIIGDYPEAAADVSWQSDWKSYSKKYDLRSGTQKITVSCEVYNINADAYFDNISLVALDESGDTLKSVVVSGPTDGGKWFTLSPKNRASGSHFVDWSSLLDAPAGKHGFMKTKDDEFIFEDGTPVKFYGTVLVSPNMFVSNSKIDSLTKRLSMMGYNLLRLHHMDAPWSKPNIFNNVTGTEKLSEKMLEKVDYLINSCKKRGIYLYIDMVDHRDFAQYSGVDSSAELGAKQIGFFNKRIIELQKSYASQILNHVNKYTKIAYKNDPAIVLSEFINETTIYSDFGDDKTLNTPYRNELEKMWKEAGYKGKLASFTLNWNGTREKLENTIEGADVQNSFRFMTSLEENYFKEMKDLFDSLGSKIIVAGSNAPLPILAMVKSNSILDYVANDAYWDHPQLWKIGGNWNRVKYAPIDNSSQLKSADNNSIELVSFYKVDKKPYMIWGNHSYPNEYQAEELPLRTAYASLQGWNGLLQHEFDNTALGGDSLESFTVSRQPEDIAMSVITAPAFLMGYIKKAPNIALEKITEEELFSKDSYSDFIDSHPYLPFITRVAKTFDSSVQTTDISKFSDYYDVDNEIIKSETGELELNKQKGILKISAPKVQGAVGFLSNEEILLPFVNFSCKNKHAGLFVISADDRPLVNSKHIYMVTVTPAKMSNQKFNKTRTKLEELGSLPVLVQQFEGSVKFNHEKAKSVTVKTISPTGSIMQTLTSRKALSEPLELSDSKAMVYDVTFQM